MSVAEQSRSSASPSKQLLAIAVVATIWVVLRIVFWIGCAGVDDLLYLLYAERFDHAPKAFWEFRLSTILLTRLIVATLGPSELAICLPTLAASLAITLSVAWFVDWPAVLDWRTTGAVLLAAVMPVDVALASYLVPTMIAAGLLAAGSVCVLKGGGRLPYVGAALLALAFWTHEMSFFYVAFFCLTALAIDARRYRGAVIACFCFSAAIVAIEAAIYWSTGGDPLARWSAAGRHGAPGFLARDRGLGFYLWPVQIAVLGKPFGFDLGLVFAAGAIVWRSLDRPRRILLVTGFLYWLWLGYGTQVPWAYRPHGRSIHYYVCLTFVIAAVLPSALALAFERRRRLAETVIVAAVCFHVASLAAGGRWGQSVDVSRELLSYAERNPQQRFLTDGNTVREMYFVNGFRMPANVAPVASYNWERKGEGMVVDDAGDFDAVMLNFERDQELVEDEFLRFMHGAWRTVWRAPVSYRWIVAPLALVLGRDELVVKSRGGEVMVRREETQPRAAVGH